MTHFQTNDDTKVDQLQLSVPGKVVLTALVSLLCIYFVLKLMPDVRPSILRTQYQQRILEVEKKYAQDTAHAMGNLAKPYLTVEQNASITQQLAAADQAPVSQKTDQYGAIVDVIFDAIHEPQEQESTLDPEKLDQWALLNELASSFRKITYWRRNIVDPVDKETTTSRFQDFRDARRRLDDALEKYKKAYQRSSP